MSIFFLYFEKTPIRHGCEPVWAAVVQTQSMVWWDIVSKTRFRYTFKHFFLLLLWKEVEKNSHRKSNDESQYVNMASGSSEKSSAKQEFPTLNDDDKVLWMKFYIHERERDDEVDPKIAASPWKRCGVWCAIYINKMRFTQWTWNYKDLN